MPFHLRPSAPIAADALLPGDPGRALALAQELHVKPLMSNHNRGLWGYTGKTDAGRDLTIQSTGMGAPSAAIVLEELAELGVRRAIRVGTCGSFDPALGLGTLLRVERAIGEDGVSRRLGVEGTVEPDAELSGLIASVAADAPGVTVATTDLFYESGDRDPNWPARGAQAVEMESAALFALGRRLGVAVGCLLVVSDVLLDGGRERIDDERLLEAATGMGAMAAAALASPPST
jgi:uridine phosphorylase